MTAVPRTSSTQYDDGPRKPRIVHTSIRANVVEAVSVTMSFAEMDEVVRMLSNLSDSELSYTQQSIRDEFIEAVNSIK